MTELPPAVEEPDQSELAFAKIAADIVVAFIARNPLDASELPGLTERVRAALSPSREPQAEAHQHVHQSHEDAEWAAANAANFGARSQKPAVPVNKSVTRDYIVCLEDGKKFRSLKRHLRSEHGLSAEAYREKWGLPKHYELVAPSYSEMRTELATRHGLGRGSKPRREVVPKIAAE